MKSLLHRKKENGPIFTTHTHHTLTHTQQPPTVTVNYDRSPVSYS